MAHKTLIGGTSYEITGGKTLVDGTSYSVKNGKVLVDGTEYDISFVLPPAALDLWSGSYLDNNCITYADGYWVVGGRYHDGSTNYARIAYATSLNGDWTIKDLAAQSTMTSVRCIAYANGYWVVGGYGGSSGTKAVIAYSTSLGGTWTFKTLWSGSTNDSVNDIAYANGYWVAAGEEGTDTAQISYATSPDGTWTNKAIWNTWTDTNYASRIETITYANGYWVVGGVHRKDDNDDDTIVRIAFATSPDDYWYGGNTTIWTGRLSCINSIAYANGYWVVAGVYGTGTSLTSSVSARIAYSTSLSGPWSTTDLWSGRSDSLDCITYADGYWVVGGDHRGYSFRIAYATSPDGTWTTEQIGADGDDLGGGGVYGIIRADGYWVAAGSLKVSNTQYARIAYSPTIEGFSEI